MGLIQITSVMLDPCKVGKIERGRIYTSSPLFKLYAQGIERTGIGSQDRQAIGKVCLRHHYDFVAGGETGQGKGLRAGSVLADGCGIDVDGAG